MESEEYIRADMLGIDTFDIHLDKYGIERISVKFASETTVDNAQVLVDSEWLQDIENTSRHLTVKNKEISFLRIEGDAELFLYFRNIYHELNLSEQSNDYQILIKSFTKSKFFDLGNNSFESRLLLNNSINFDASIRTDLFAFLYAHNKLFLNIIYKSSELSILYSILECLKDKVNIHFDALNLSFKTFLYTDCKPEHKDMFVGLQTYCDNLYFLFAGESVRVVTMSVIFDNRDFEKLLDEINGYAICICYNQLRDEIKYPLVKRFKDRIKFVSSEELDIR
jgi:hypothetical protein